MKVFQFLNFFQQKNQLGIIYVAAHYVKEQLNIESDINFIEINNKKIELLLINIIFTLIPPLCKRRPFSIIITMKSSTNYRDLVTVCLFYCQSRSILVQKVQSVKSNRSILSQPDLFSYIHIYFLSILFLFSLLARFFLASL